MGYHLKDRASSVSAMSTDMIDILQGLIDLHWLYSAGYPSLSASPGFILPAHSSCLALFKTHWLTEDKKFFCLTFVIFLKNAIQF